LFGALLDSFKQVLPPDASALVASATRELNASAVLGAGAKVAAIGAAWGALNGTWAIIAGLNKAYEVEEERPWWRVLFITFGLTISLSVLGLIALATVLYDHRAEDIIGQHLGADAHFGFLWPLLHWLVIVILLVLSFAVLYRSGSNLRDRRWQLALQCFADNRRLKIPLSTTPPTT
jgi:membrane protein